MQWNGYSWRQFVDRRNGKVFEYLNRAGIATPVNKVEGENKDGSSHQELVRRAETRFRQELRKYAGGGNRGPLAWLTLRRPSG